ncbi:PEP-CTERM sorting domain-containing protein [Microcystis protocystis FBCC-A270]
MERTFQPSKTTANSEPSNLSALLGVGVAIGVGSLLKRKFNRQ